MTFDNAESPHPPPDPTLELSLFKKLIICLLSTNARQAEYGKIQKYASLVEVYCSKLVPDFGELITEGIFHAAVL